MTVCIDYVTDVHEINIWLIWIIVLLIFINAIQEFYILHKKYYPYVTQDT